MLSVLVCRRLRLGMLIPIAVLQLIMFCKNRVFGWGGGVQEFYEQVLVQLGSVFPNTSAVYFNCWRAVLKHDSSELMFCEAFWCVFGFGWAR